jgi:hypothetical protein
MMVGVKGEQTMSSGGLVSTAFPSASEAAIEILQAGGNAIDAAMAAAWALAVCEPSGSGLGGQTILLIHFADGRAIIIDGHSYWRGVRGNRNPRQEASQAWRPVLQSDCTVEKSERRP